MGAYQGPDGDRLIDWGKTSADYAVYRPGYPASFFEHLKLLGVGLPGQRILDLGCGTGVLARVFAGQGCEVTAVDLSPEQVEVGRALAAEQGVRVDFRVAPAESTGCRAGAFDVLTASQSWLYFNPARAVAESERLLRLGGRLMLAHLNWLPRRDPVVAATEALVLRHNPHWTAGDYAGLPPFTPGGFDGHFRTAAMIAYEERLPFTYATWRGRVRACRGIGAALDPEAVARFDAEHAALLAELTTEPFGVLHQVLGHVMVAEG